MELEVDNLTGAGHGERSDDRLNSRNGYRTRNWETRAGTVPVAIPKLRKGSYFPSFLDPRRTSEKALVAVIQEAYVQGVSTRSVDELVKSMGMSGISKSQVSRLCEDIDVRVKMFLNRPIEGSWPYLWIDATYIKVREGGRIVSVAVIIAVAVNTDGRREVLGMQVGASEAEPFWTKFLRSLMNRGLRGVKLVDLRLSRGPQGRRQEGAPRELATLPRALHAQCPGQRPGQAARHDRRRHPHRVHTGDGERSAYGVPGCRRPSARPLSARVGGNGRR